MKAAPSIRMSFKWMGLLATLALGVSLASPHAMAAEPTVVAGSISVSITRDAVGDQFSNVINGPERMVFAASQGNVPIDLVFLHKITAPGYQEGSYDAVYDAIHATWKANLTVGTDGSILDAKTGGGLGGLTAIKGGSAFSSFGWQVDIPAQKLNAHVIEYYYDPYGDGTIDRGVGPFLTLGNAQVSNGQIVYDLFSTQLGFNTFGVSAGHLMGTLTISTTVPEPASLALLLAGVASVIGAGAMKRRMRS